MSITSKIRGAIQRSLAQLGSLFNPNGAKALAAQHKKIAQRGIKIEQIYTGCLAHGAYYIESDGEAVVIDPLREVDPYLKRAARDSAKIKYVFETHFHADFVSGHLDLSRKANAPIVYGPTAKPGFEAIVAEDGQEFKAGRVSFTVLHTPGHTMESSCFLLKDETGKPLALFSGDTLFIGDVGRPDLAQKVRAELTQDLLANHLYASLRNKILPLSDDIIVYPGHGAGSACGKNMSKETVDTLGHQKAVNYALRPGLTKEDFIRELTTGLVTPPAYFPLNVLMNIQGCESIDTVLERGMRALNAGSFVAAANETGALILDVRDPETFAAGFIPGSINIGLDGQFAPWVGALIPDIKQAILLVAEEGREAETIMRLSRVGYDNVTGYLDGGFESWRKTGKEMDTIHRINPNELATLVKKNAGLPVLDVRRNSEYLSEHLLVAENTPLDTINESLPEIPRNQTVYLHCAGGYRSMIFASILKSRGYNNIADVRGGFAAIRAARQLPMSEYVCPTSML